ncbi:uncharacterized protein BO66DRAFT_239474 [Aspergillus aculeatinus CBS 121060]|uniref:Uncharacterized protein n=1 Tax=Aspergillus aculeatinus CBS 121060 TaxID=1448322 RepID=A0ACD1HI47_9EURO|nr:hypothetical protein BO66DRAFT_239474 [Aspergillus aculeatinus CBS 121060]RAH73304.1 hypothetical protein BO66DRAFT_239474 [Aspergillus aculeatinus CBS 121060]
MRLRAGQHVRQSPSLSVSDTFPALTCTDYLVRWHPDPVSSSSHPQKAQATQASGAGIQISLPADQSLLNREPRTFFYLVPTTSSPAHDLHRCKAIGRTSCKTPLSCSQLPEQRNATQRSHVVQHSLSGKRTPHELGFCHRPGHGGRPPPLSHYCPRGKMKGQ